MLGKSLDSIKTDFGSVRTLLIYASQMLFVGKFQYSMNKKYENLQRHNEIEFCNFIEILTI